MVNEPNGLGRQLLPGATDLAAEKRVPTKRLHLIPAAARASFVPWDSELPRLRIGENDLTRISLGRPQAEGEILEISGRVVDEFNRPLPRTLVEIWNANKWGRYTHIEDTGREKLDPNFLGFGRALTDESGIYRFRTIKPGAYLARADIDRWRPAHIHFSVRSGSARLVTQMYFDGDTNLTRDPMFSLLGAAQSLHFGQLLKPSSNNESFYHWDIVIGGRNARFFESS